MSVDGTPVLKFDKHGKPAWRHKLRPGGVYKDGRCVEYQVLTYVATRHELRPRVEDGRPSKHARGRIRPRTRAEAALAARRRARFAQIMKTYTIDAQRMAAAVAEG